MGWKGKRLKWMIGLIAALALFSWGAAAEEAPLFSVAALRDYAASAGFSFRMDGLTPWMNWRYAMSAAGTETYRYDGGRGDAPRLQLLIAGNGDDAYPYLGLSWTDSESWRAQTVALHVDGRFYRMELGTSRSFVHCQRQGEGAYAYTLLIPLGSDGPALLSALRGQGFRFRVRVGDKARTRLAAQWNGEDVDAYERFYEGLTASGYLDGEGRVQRSVWDGLRMIDDIDYFPVVTACLVTGDLGPEADGAAIDDAPVQALPQTVIVSARTRVELTGRCAYKRGGDAARFTVGVRNVAEDAAVTQLTFYLCVQYDGETTFFSQTDSSLPLEATEDVTLKPGKKGTVVLRLDGMTRARAVLIGVREVVYADGTVETVPLRDIVFIRRTLR